MLGDWLLRHGPLSAAILRVNAGGLKTGNRCPGSEMNLSRLLPRQCLSKTLYRRPRPGSCFRTEKS
jgi:hypothetical protein